MPITLNWIVNEFGEQIAVVPAKDYRGVTGHFVIYACPRPHYCDRGSWHVIIEPSLINGLDSYEGFPRYYFKWENLHSELTIWVNKRKECIEAAKDLGPLKEMKEEV